MTHVIRFFAGPRRSACGERAQHRWQIQAYNGHLDDPADFRYRYEDTPLRQRGQACDAGCSARGPRRQRPDPRSRTTTIEAAALRHDETTLIVAHCGHEGYAERLRLMSVYENLWGNLTPVVYDRPGLTTADFEQFSHRIMLGTDAPNVGVTLASQLEWLRSLDLQPDTLEAVLGGNAQRLAPTT